MKTVVIVTGGFDPIHGGHIDYFNSSKQLGDILVVGLNSDAWLSKKKGSCFMDFDERKKIIENLKCVDHVISFNDTDSTALDAIAQTQLLYPDHKIIFANGGDRTSKNIPESLSNFSNVEFKFGIGGTDKVNSSSRLLDNWKAPKTIRPWGFYRILYEKEGFKVKELCINPHQSLSMQRHIFRLEFWMIVSGQCAVRLLPKNNVLEKELYKHDEITIPKLTWHQLYNPFDRPANIIEIQYGDVCSEDDIERKNILT